MQSACLESVMINTRAMTSKPSFKDAILRTLCYADIFDFPLTSEEIHRFLICDQNQNISEVAECLPAEMVGTPRTVEKAMRGAEQMSSINGYYFLKGRRRTVLLRRKREKHARKKAAIAKGVGKWLMRIPTIKMVALTGALAMQNSEENDDIDLMIITSRNRLWITRLFVVPLVSLVAERRKPLQKYDSVAMPARRIPTSRRENGGKQWNNAICLNLFLNETALSLHPSQRNLYTAHEVAQVKPIWTRDRTHERFLTQNTWILEHLPNALPKSTQQQPNRQRKNTKGIRQEVENRPARPGDILETVAYRLQKRYMRAKKTREIVRPNAAFFHPRDTAKLVLEKYQRRLKRYGCMPETAT